MRPLHRLSHPREVIRQFTPQWFVVTMGTGVMAMVLPHLLDSALEPLAVGLWLLDIALFVLFCGLYAARWALYPREAAGILSHGTAALFFGAIPMSLAVIVNGLLAFGPEMVGPGVVAWAQGLWLVDVAISVACGLLVPYLMFTRQTHNLEGMTALWLLPVVATEVAGNTGGLLIPYLTDPATQMAVLVASYALWVCSIPVALAILTILLLRMALHRLPPVSLAATSWLSLGPVAMGSLGIQVLGGEARHVLAARGLGEIGVVADGLGVIGGLLFWGVGLWWLGLAVLVTLRTRHGGAIFGLGWWAYVFPLGVYVLATFHLGEALAFAPLEVVAVGLTLLLVAAWAVVGLRTLAGAWAGHLFAAPYVAAPDKVGS